MNLNPDFERRQNGMCALIGCMIIGSFLIIAAYYALIAFGIFKGVDLIHREGGIGKFVGKTVTELQGDYNEGVREATSPETEHPTGRGVTN